MDAEWSLSGPDAELVDNTDVSEQVLQAPVTFEINERNIDTVKESIAKHFSTLKVGFLKVGTPKPEDEKIRKKESHSTFWTTTQAEPP
jgi:hypothetical protein